MTTAILFIIVLAVLIFVHELGHFLAAKLFGIRVDAFKIGFGPKIFAWKRGETEYGLNLIPFGGYVKIFGENPDEQSLDVAGSDASRSFVLKPRWQQTIVLAAGVLFNFAFAWLLYIIVFTSGVTGPIDGFPGYERYSKDSRILVTYIKPGSPIEKSGLKMGDTITRVMVMQKTATSTTSVTAQPTVDGITSAIRASGGGLVTVDYSRGPAHDSGIATATPVSHVIADSPNAYAVGMSMSQVVTLKLPIWISVWESLRYTGMMMHDMASSISTLISNAFIGQAHLSDVTGPVGIAVVVGDNARLGFNYLLETVAFISINLGIVNLIPFPALDGGRIMFVAIEAILRRRVSTQFFNIINFIGFALLMVLMVIITWKDMAGLIFK